MHIFFAQRNTKKIKGAAVRGVVVRGGEGGEGGAGVWCEMQPQQETGK